MSVKPLCSTDTVDVCFTYNGQFPLLDTPAGSHGTCIYHLGVDIYFDECDNHDSL